MAKVLIVDDAPLIVQRIAAVFNPLGHECIPAGNGLEAIEIYSRVRPAAVFLDIAMPVMDGISALRAIREVDPQARVTIITGVGQQATVEEAVSAGAVDFIVKPFDNQRLLTALARMLA